MLVRECSGGGYWWRIDVASRVPALPLPPLPRRPTLSAPLPEHPPLLPAFNLGHAPKHKMQSARDIPMIIASAASSSERRITPSWTIAHLKTKLEPVTGIPPTSQKLLLRTPGRPEKVIEAANEESAQVGQWQLVDYAEIHVCTPCCRESVTLVSRLHKPP